MKIDIDNLTKDVNFPITQALPTEKVSGFFNLLKSWATPPASSPRDLSFSERRSWSFIICLSVISLTIIRAPVLPLTLIPIIDQGLIFTQSRRCLHDWLCGTSVVNK